MLDKLLKLNNKTPQEKIDTIYNILKEKYEIKPHTIEQFIEKFDLNIFPYWKKFLKDCYWNSPYVSENKVICFSGAIGTGKTFIPLVSMLYEVWLIENIKDIEKEFNLQKNEKLKFFIVNPNKKCLENITKPLVYSLINKIYKKLKIQKADKIHLNNCEIIFSTDIINKKYENENILFANIDLSDFQYTISEKEMKNYSGIIIDGISTLSERIRLKNKDNCFSGTVWVTSATDNYLSNNYQLLKNKLHHNVLINTNVPIWKVKDAPNLEDEVFNVFLGNMINSDINIDPKILTENEYNVISKIYPNKNLYLKVPEYYRTNFEKNLIYSIRDLGGIYIKNNE